MKEIEYMNIKFTRFLENGVNNSRSFPKFYDSFLKQSVFEFCRLPKFREEIDKLILGVSKGHVKGQEVKNHIEISADEGFEKALPKNDSLSPGILRFQEILEVWILNILSKKEKENHKIALAFRSAWDDW